MEGFLLKLKLPIWHVMWVDIRCQMLHWTENVSCVTVATETLTRIFLDHIHYNSMKNGFVRIVARILLEGNSRNSRRK